MTLGEQVRDFAKYYVALVEALQAEGVSEKVARNEARATALIMCWEAEDTEGESCPLCGRGGIDE